MNLSKRRFCVTVPLALMGLALARVATGEVHKKTPVKERVIKIEAKKFVYTPTLIELKLGEAAVLEFSSVDFTHGFNIPDLKIRADLLPGKITKIRLMPDTVGKFTFLCDNFCGSGHEEMNGTIIVKA